MIVIALLGGTAAFIALLLALLRLFAIVGAGYKAKVLCTATFVSGRTMDPATDDQISAESYWILRPVRAEIDVNQGTVTASVMGVITRQVVYRHGLGATLVTPGEPLITLHDVVEADDAVGQARALGGSVATESASAQMAAFAPGGARRRAAQPRNDASAAIPIDGAEATTSRRTAGSGATALSRVVDAAFLEPHRRRRRTQAVLIMQDGAIRAERYAPGFTADTPLPGWSMAKSVLSSLVGILVQDARLALSERELLPQWRAPDPRADITLEDLLRMRSGLRFSEAYALPWSDVLRMLYRSSDMGGYSADRPLAHKPGSVWQYASGTSNILSLICRRAVGDAAIASWPRRALFDRLGMTSAVLEPDASGTFVCSSYMVATARDWARYGQLWLDDGRVRGQQLLDRPWIRFSTTPTPQSPQGRYGAHWWLRLNPEIGGETSAAARIPSDAFFAVGHEAQTLTVIPSKRLVVVRLGGSIHIDAWNQAQFIADICDVV